MTTAYEFCSRDSWTGEYQGVARNLTGEPISDCRIIFGRFEPKGRGESVSGACHIEGVPGVPASDTTWITGTDRDAPPRITWPGSDLALNFRTVTTKGGKPVRIRAPLRDRFSSAEAVCIADLRRVSPFDSGTARSDFGIYTGLLTYTRGGTSALRISCHQETSPTCSLFIDQNLIPSGFYVDYFGPDEIFIIFQAWSGEGIGYEYFGVNEVELGEDGFSLRSLSGKYWYNPKRDPFTRLPTSQPLGTFVVYAEEAST